MLNNHHDLQNPYAELCLLKKSPYSDTRKINGEAVCHLKLSKILIALVGKPLVSTKNGLLLLLVSH